MILPSFFRVYGADLISDLMSMAGRDDVTIAERFLDLTGTVTMAPTETSAVVKYESSFTPFDLDIGMTVMMFMRLFIPHLMIFRRIDLG